VVVKYGFLQVQLSTPWEKLIKAQLLWLFWIWGRWDLNPHALRHMILSHACLPVPARPLVWNAGEL
jgi:hypothetical protein